MTNIVKSLIADFHARGLPSGVVKRDLLVPLDVPKVISVIGPRRAGKTWFLYSLMEQLAHSIGFMQVVYINFEDERLRFDAASLGSIVDAYQQLYPEHRLDQVHFFFDEIQEVTGWEKFVRRMVDTVSPHVFVTGSSAKLLSREIATSLRGRTLAYTLFPFSFREYLRFSGVDRTATDTAGRNRIIALFDRFLEEGGYPETLRMDESARIKTLQSYFEIMLYRDIVERFEVKRPHLVKDFARRLLANNAQALSVHKYYRDLRSRNIRVTKDTLYAFAEHFTDACFAFPAAKYDASEAKQAQALKKYYVNDTGLLNACVHIPAERIGAMLETLVFLELRKQGKAVTYFSEAQECDFIVIEKGSPSGAVQVCHELTDDNRRRELAGLAAAMNRFGLKEGTIVTRRQEQTVQMDAGVARVVPAWKWCIGL